MYFRLKKIAKKLLVRSSYRMAAHDDFILRLRCTVIGEGMLHPGNIYLMEKAIQEMPAGGCVLEIGSYGGLSANLLTHLLQRYQRETALFCCDPWVYEGFHDAAGMATPWMDGRTDVGRAAYMAYIKQAFISAAKLLHPNRLPKAIQLDSDAFFHAWRQESIIEDVFGRDTQLGGPIAFAYVDGNHAYDFARRDVENVLEFLLPGGFLLLDDSAKHLRFGSVRLAQELRRRPELETILANPHYLFRKK